MFRQKDFAPLELRKAQKLTHTHNNQRKPHTLSDKHLIGFAKKSVGQQ